MLLADLVATSAAVGATRSRKEKVAALSALLRGLEPNEVEPAVAFLTGAPRQGRIGVGWRTAFGVDVAHAAEPSITVTELDSMLGVLATTSGAGPSVCGRRSWVACSHG